MNNKKKIIGFAVILICLLVIVTPFLVSCSDAGDPISQETIFNLLFPNLWVFVSILMAAVILIITIIWFIWVPMNKKFDERKVFIMKELEDAKQAKDQALEDEQKAQNELIKTQYEINDMLSKASIKASAIKDEIKNDANAKAALLIENAKKSIELEKQQMVEKMEDQIMDIAFAAVTEISKQKITKEENDKLVKDFIDNFDNVSEE